LLDESFRLRPGSPAVARALVEPAPLRDKEGNARGKRPDIGASERREVGGESLEGLTCGDGIVQQGEVSTSAGKFQAFETCDDLNRVSGDGCSEFCQREPTPTSGRLAYAPGSLCAVRGDGALSCWGDLDVGLPTGTFRQVALNTDYGCALRLDGAVACWRPDGNHSSYAPTGSYTYLAAGSDETCGVLANGGIQCWGAGSATRSQVGSFARVATNSRLCTLSTAGALRCFPEYDPAALSGAFLGVMPGSVHGCGHALDGTLACTEGLGRRIPAAGFQSASFNVTHSAVGVRPDGRVVHVRVGGITMPVVPRRFTEAVTIGVDTGCGLTSDHKVYCWVASGSYPKE
jgi:cysteine-rich repeat protein